MNTDKPMQTRQTDMSDRQKDVQKIICRIMSGERRLNVLFNFVGTIFAHMNVVL